MGSPDDYRIQDGDRFVRVVLHCRLVDSADADRLLSDVDGALTRTGFDRVMFDYRGVEDHAEEVRDAMWLWATERSVESIAVAVLVDREMMRVRTNMTALSRRVRLRAFMDEEEATQWLREPGRRTRELPSM